MQQIFPEMAFIVWFYIDKKCLFSESWNQFLGGIIWPSKNSKSPNLRVQITLSFILRAGWKKSRGLVPGSGKRFLYSPKNIDGLLWGQQIPTSFISLSFYWLWTFYFCILNLRDADCSLSLSLSVCLMPPYFILWILWYVFVMFSFRIRVCWACVHYRYASPLWELHFQAGLYSFIPPLCQDASPWVVSPFVDTEWEL